MSFFSEVFSTENSDTLPDWLRSGAALADAGIDLYDRIAGGAEEPTLPPIREQAAAPIPSVSLTPMVMLVLVAVGGYLLLGLARRR